MDISELGKTIGGMMGLSGKAGSGNNLGGLMDSLKPLSNYFPSLSQKKEEAEAKTDTTEAPAETTTTESKEESGIAKLGKALGSMFGEQASGSGTYSSPEIPQMSASPFEQTDWHSRTPFAPTSGRRLR